MNVYDWPPDVTAVNVTCCPGTGIVPLNVATTCVVVLGCTTAGLGLRFAPDALRVVAPNGQDTESNVSGTEPELMRFTVTVLPALENTVSLILTCAV